MDEAQDDELRAAWITEQDICWACASRERVTDGGARPKGAVYRTRNRAKDAS